MPTNTPVPFEGYPGETTPGRQRIPHPVPQCPLCKTAFSHLHCSHCFLLFCVPCKLTYRPDTTVWKNEERDTGQLVPNGDGRKVVDEDLRRVGNWDGLNNFKPGPNGTRERDPGPCVGFFE